MVAEKEECEERMEEELTREKENRTGEGEKEEKNVQKGEDRRWRSCRRCKR